MVRILADDIAALRAAGSKARPVRHGFRRVDLVRFVICDEGRWAEVIGATHRAPRRRRVPFRVALGLARSGAPVQVVDRRSADSSNTLD